MGNIVEQNNGNKIFVFRPNDGIPEYINLTGIRSIKVECYGAGSQTRDPNIFSRGGYTKGILDVSDINHLWVFVGCKPEGRIGGKGFGKGGDSFKPNNEMVGYGGGGSSAISIFSDDKNYFYMIAAGAGGGTDFVVRTSNNDYLIKPVKGLDGGGYEGESLNESNGDPALEFKWYNSGYSGKPGTQTAGGYGGSLDKNSISTQFVKLSNGSKNNGGNGLKETSTITCKGGAPGGGAGYYGGGGGDIKAGGGSSYISGDPNCSDEPNNDHIIFTDTETIVGGNNELDGKVVITVLKADIEPYEIYSKINVFEYHSKYDVTIPFPYKQFTEMQFFIIDKEGKLIPSSYYDRIDNYTIRIKDNTDLQISSDRDLKFVFAHNKGQYAVQKMELNFECETNKYQYNLLSPYYMILDIRNRFKVFFNRKELVHGVDYTINIYKGILNLSDSIDVKNGDSLDVICFYTGTKYNKAIPELPMSGYIYYNKNEIDRNLNKNLTAIFVNGKLVDREDELDISNTIHKISTDIKSRYNLEVLNLSPKVDSLVPKFKLRKSRNKVPKYVNEYIYGTIDDYKTGSFSKDILGGKNGNGVIEVTLAPNVVTADINVSNAKMFKIDYKEFLFNDPIQMNYIPKYAIQIQQVPHQTISVVYNGKEYSNDDIIYVLRGDTINPIISPEKGYRPGTPNISRNTPIMDNGILTASDATELSFAYGLIPINSRGNRYDEKRDLWTHIRDRVITIPNDVDRVVVNYTWHSKSDEWSDVRDGYATMTDVLNRIRNGESVAETYPPFSGTGIYNLDTKTPWFNPYISHTDSKWYIPAYNEYITKPEEYSYYIIMGVTPGKTYNLRCFASGFKMRDYGFVVGYNEDIAKRRIDMTDY